MKKKTLIAISIMTLTACIGYGQAGGSGGSGGAGGSGAAGGSTAGAGGSTAGSGSGAASGAASGNAGADSSRTTTRETLPPGLQRRDPLPPGLQNREQLPPGLQGRTPGQNNPAVNDQLPGSAQNPDSRVPAAGQVMRDSATTAQDRTLLLQLRHAVASQVPSLGGAAAGANASAGAAANPGAVSGTAPLPVNFLVHNGIVRLSGSVPSAADRQRIQTVVEGIPGVVQVMNQLQIRSNPNTSSDDPTSVGGQIGTTATSPGLTAAGQPVLTPTNTLPPTGRTNTRPFGLPPGLQNRDQLPPGLDRRDDLPRGLSRTNRFDATP